MRLLRVQSIPSHKLLLLAYQMASRLGPRTAASSFQSVLQLMLARMAAKHPHHVLLPLAALQSGGGDGAAGAKAAAAKDVLQVLPFVACPWLPDLCGNRVSIATSGGQGADRSSRCPCWASCCFHVRLHGAHMQNQSLAARVCPTSVQASHAAPASVSKPHATTYGPLHRFTATCVGHAAKVCHPCRW